MRRVGHAYQQCTPPQLGTLCLKMNAPMFHWPKLSPGSLVLDFDPNWAPPHATPNRWPPQPQMRCTLPK